MKAKLLKKVRKKVLLCGRNRIYYVYDCGILIYEHANLIVAKVFYRNAVIRLAKELSNYKCKKRLL